jgi:hypothetical protein
MVVCIGIPLNLYSKDKFNTNIISNFHDTSLLSLLKLFQQSNINSSSLHIRNHLVFDYYQTNRHRHRHHSKRKRSEPIKQIINYYFIKLILIYNYSVDHYYEGRLLFVLFYISLRLFTQLSKSSKPKSAVAS